MNYDSLAVELIRALRGRRSCAEFSRRAGYRSNIAHRWEARRCWPTAARFLQVQQLLRPGSVSWLARFYRGAAPEWVAQCDPASSTAVAHFLRHIKGKTPIVRVAELAQCSRFSVSRWLDGSCEPKLPEFLRLVDVGGRRLLDLVAALDDPTRLASTREAWAQLQLAREGAYSMPWSHAVLRALEIDDGARTVPGQVRSIAQQLGIAASEVEAALRVLKATGQVHKTRRGFRPRQVMVVDTGRDPARNRELKLSWTKTALQRLEADAPGSFGYSVFAISKPDLVRLQTLHLEYVRAMQEVIASSSPNECVGLYCAQLLDLGATGDPKLIAK